jgi:hypothetical protein
MIRSWETSTRRLVRYPESAVRSAVSESPFLAPCAEMKYSRTSSPSRKLLLIGKFDRMSGRIGHQSAHACQLLNLLFGTTGSGIRHHLDVVVGIQSRHQIIGQTFSSVCLPGLIDDCLVTFVFRGKSESVVVGNLFHGSLRLFDQLLLCDRNLHIRDGNRHARKR